MCFLHAEHGVFLFGSINSQAFQAQEVRVPSLMTSLPFLTHHRQPSRGPVEASRLLSVSEASVCSVDMDEMSLIDDDWEGVALLLTAASVLKADLSQHHSCFFLPSPLLLCKLALSTPQSHVLFLPIGHRKSEVVAPLPRRGRTRQ